MYLRDLFHVINGISSNAVEVKEHQDDVFNIPYFRPTSAFENVIVGFVDSRKIDDRYVFDKETLFVSTDGDGSHSYAYVSPIRFIPNSNVSVLIPKREMSLNEKIFYAFAITKNRYRFSYGRKPKGERLKTLILPVEIPKNFEEFNLLIFKNFHIPLSTFSKNFTSVNWQLFKYGELFDLKKGKRLTKSEMIEGNTPFVGAIDSNNGVSDFVGQDPIFEGNTITVNYDGNGVAESYYQAIPYFALDSVNVLYPKFNLNPFIAMFLIVLIRKEKFRFNYGRKWHLGRMIESTIKLPVTSEGNPDWDFMENYIKSLPYSKSLVV